jgi:hypothetical protein
MTHTQPVAGRKLSRVGLYAPFAVAVVLIIAWSLGWLWLKSEAERRIDSAAASLRAGGGQIAWASRHIHGYPFRLDADFTDLHVADGSGWGLTLPELDAEALAFAPTHWMLVAPKGAVFAWPGDGPITVGASALRASIAGLKEHPPRISVEGQNLTFASAPGAKPFFLTAARDFQLYTRAGPQDQGAFLIGVGQARAQPDSRFARLANGGPVTFRIDLIFSHASAMKGADWPAAMRGWTAAGGGFSVRQVVARLGAQELDARDGNLAVDAHGDLDGVFTGALREPAPGADDAAPDVYAPQVSLTIKDGRMTLAGTDLGPAPRAF